MIREAIEKLALGPRGDEPHLTESESETVALEIMTGEATPAQVGAFLGLLRARGEQVEQVVGFVRAMRRNMVAFPKFPSRVVVIDTCGTGGDRAGTFNISTAAAFLVAAAGVPVAKHGNRSVSSRCGSSDVIAALGIDIMPDPAAAAACLDELNLCFLFAPQYHPAMKHAAVPRREIGIRTIFNLCGPLANPALPTHQLIGVPDRRLLDLVARSLARLGIQRALVVHGTDALDEITPAMASMAAFVERDGSIRNVTINPDELGLPPCETSDLVGGSAEDNARILEDEVLPGKPTPRTHAAALNAAAALWVVGEVDGLVQGLERIQAALKSGKAVETLHALRRRLPAKTP
jgi:anthranilate phosphoribosyltransferase